MLAEARAQEVSKTRAKEIEIGSTSATSARHGPSKKHSHGPGGQDRHSTSSASTDSRKQARGRGMVVDTRTGTRANAKDSYAETVVGNFLTEMDALQQARNAIHAPTPR